jgi:hypothetical protein
MMANMADSEQANLIWKSDSSSVEIRFQGRLEDGRPALDEIVATCAAIHLEQMSRDQWWMGIEAGGRCFQLNFSLDDGRLHVHLSDQTDDQGEHYAEWEATIGRSRFQESMSRAWRVLCSIQIIGSTSMSAAKDPTAFGDT